MPLLSIKWGKIIPILQACFEAKKKNDVCEVLSISFYAKTLLIVCFYYLAATVPFHLCTFHLCIISVDTISVSILSFFFFFLASQLVGLSS